MVIWEDSNCFSLNDTSSLISEKRCWEGKVDSTWVVVVVVVVVVVRGGGGGGGGGG